MSHSIAKTRQLKDTHIEFEEKVEEQIIHNQKALVYYGKLATCPADCPHCGADILVRNGCRTVRVTLPSISNFAAYVMLCKQRYLCRACRQTYTCQSDCVAPHCNLSRPLKLTVMDCATQLQPEKRIARHTHLSVSSVRRIISHVASTLRYRPIQSLPEHLCFDEFKSVRSVSAAMSFIVCDADSHQLIDIVENRRLDVLKAYFLRYDLAVRRQVKTITIDKYTPYMRLIQRCFPNANVILDPFHLV